MRRISTGRNRLLLAAAALVAAACGRSGGGGEGAPAPRPEPAERREAPAVGPRSDEPAEAVSPETPAHEAPSPTAALDRVREVAEAMLADGGGPRWARETRLGPEDLTNRYATACEEGVEVFSVLDAEGYEGYYKCNLFAFEVAYRAGLRVPVISRFRGWTYPGPLAVFRMIEGEGVGGDWARVVSSLDLEDLEAAVAEGRALLAVGLGVRGRHGHMGVVEQVHGIERDVEGRIRTLEYTGWEANPEGASFGRRRWGPGRFAEISLLELRDPPADERQIVAVGPPPDEPSVADLARFDEAALDEAARNPRRGDMTAWPGGSRIPEDGAPWLPVVHTVLGSDSVFGEVVDVDRVIEPEGRAAADAVRRTRLDRPVIDVDRVLEAGRGEGISAEETR